MTSWAVNPPDAEVARADWDDVLSKSLQGAVVQQDDTN